MTAVLTSRALVSVTVLWPGRTPVVAAIQAPHLVLWGAPILQEFGSENLGLYTLGLVLLGCVVEALSAQRDRAVPSRLGGSTVPASRAEPDLDIIRSPFDIQA